MEVVGTVTRRTVHNVLGVGVLLLLGGGAWGWWYMATGRYPLAGRLSHDFGSVAIVGRAASFEHTFHLRNRTDRTVVIEAIRPGCGCTSADASTRTVAPGESVDLDVTLTLSRAGKKRTSVQLVLADFGVQSVWVQAVGRKETGLSAAVDFVYLRRGMASPFLISADIQSGDETPADPTISTPAAVSVTFQGWQPVVRRDARTQRPARWRGRMSIEWTGEELPPDAVMTVELGAAPPLTFSLVEGE